jgi:hypothetical protein
VAKEDFSRGGRKGATVFGFLCAVAPLREKNCLAYGGAMAIVTVLLVAPCREILTLMFPLSDESCGKTITTCHNQS